MSRCMDQECAHVWVAVVKALPEEQMKFALNAALDVLPHNSTSIYGRRRTALPAPSVEGTRHSYMC